MGATIDWQQPDNLNKLLTCSDAELQVAFPDHNLEGLRRTRRKYLEKIRQLQQRKVLPTMSSGEHIPEPTNPGVNASSERLDKLSDLLERSGINIDDVEQVTRANIWQGFIKNAEGEVETVDLASVSFVPKHQGHVEDHLSQADPTDIHPVALQSKEDTDAYQRIIVLPDVQAAFRRINDKLEPTHSEEAIDIALQIIQDYQPHLVIFNGDNIDFPTLSRFGQEAAFRGTMKATINYVHQLLAKVRANAPEAHIVYIEGNHEERMTRYINSKAPELGDMYQAGSDEPLHSVPFMLNMNAIGNIEYVGGYPASSYWVSDDLQVIHGQKVGATAGATVAKLLNSDNSHSTVQGHVHRSEIGFRNRSMRRNGETIGRTVLAASFGTLAKITGEVPSYGAASDIQGKPIRSIEDWQNGIGQIEVEKATGRVALAHAILIDTFNPTTPYATRWNGKTYVPNA